MIPLMTRFETWDEALRTLGGAEGELDRVLEGFAAGVKEFPAINVWSNQEKAVVTAEVPGVDPAAMHIAVQGSLVTLEGERQAEELGADAAYHQHERRQGRFSRSIRLPFEVAPEKVTAHYKQGILEVVLPRHERTLPRKIAVTGE